MARPSTSFRRAVRPDFRQGTWHRSTDGGDDCISRRIVRRKIRTPVAWRWLSRVLERRSDRRRDRRRGQERDGDRRRHCRWHVARRSEEHTSELQSLMRISYAVFCLKKKKTDKPPIHNQ